MTILLVCSSGGHFKALQQLRPFWENQERVWVTFRTKTTEAELTEEQVYWAYSPTNRNLPNLCKNLLLSWQLIRKTRPDVIISTGAGVAVPFLILGKLLGSKTVFIESVTRVNTLSLSARLALPFLSVLYVQWPQLQARYPQAELVIPQEVLSY
ncbi:PssD/Cps14F family polysaccharide biosynthesis glycosyltransferase [Nodularia sp. UHCC 0506]|uniref:PssD/Cps14F family polysaccharide biosynthesis glycosyltransferase n=1 Tax=Nodularia sp. UHCC 0506 TaxID=3110243 RepID=UPI002B21D3A7|nr:PssD/Cps14F family polysaccharide biosynthesis glycosyltransferase [Nodularia sp. UHCC 0506]MEA5512658.1 PssD/Cps14F family polysaccharide biosynthesis glycosyltransferase [Nodularia sp. UHCC 0506]